MNWFLVLIEHLVIVIKGGLNFMFKSFYIIHFEFQNAHFVPNTNAVTSFNKKNWLIVQL